MPKCKMAKDHLLRSDFGSRGGFLEVFGAGVVEPDGLLPTGQGEGELLVGSDLCLAEG